ncbi:LysE family translocator (plasmid) [Acinetobacter baumannii]|jgi:RhtB (resistance to homoserine/threonine) family protein
MFYLQEFLLLATVHFLAVVAPGPDFAVVVQQSVSWGRKIGAITALGIGAGISVHVLYTILGFGLLIQTNELVFNAVKVVSALYLIYLGLSLIRSNLKKVDVAKNEQTVEFLKDQQVPSAKSAFLKGFITNATNPKATIFFLGIFTTVVHQSTPLNIQFLYGIWMCFVNAAWFIVVAYLFTTQKVRSAFLQKKKWFEIFMGLVLILLAIRLLISFNFS